MTRRTFVKLAAAAGLAATVTPVWAAEVKNDMLYRSLGNTGEKISARGWAVTTSAFKATRPKAFASSAPPWIAALLSSTTAGIITTV